MGLRAISVALSAVLWVTAGEDSRAADNQPPAKKDTLPSFQDVTHEAGLTYKITCGDPVTESLMDVNGQGACFLDYDGDGRLDIYMANGSSRSLDRAGKPPHDYLLKNQGDGTFADVTESAGLGDTSWSSGCAVGDYDNDGDADLYVTNYGPNKLYRNTDGVFTEASKEAGVGGPASGRRQSGAWVRRSRMSTTMGIWTCLSRTSPRLILIRLLPLQPTRALVVLTRIFNLMYELQTIQRPSASLLIGARAR